MAFHTPKELKTNDSKHHPSPLEVQPTKHFVAGQLRKNLGMIHGSRIPDPTKWAKFGRLGLPESLGMKNSISFLQFDPERWFESTQIVMFLRVFITHIIHGHGIFTIHLP